MVICRSLSTQSGDKSAPKWAGEYEVITWCMGLICRRGVGVFSCIKCNSSRALHLTNLNLFSVRSTVTTTKWLKKVCLDVSSRLNLPLLTIVSKHSRAARRGEIVDGEAKLLERIANTENNDIKKSIIRTTIKNENLLARKMELNRVRKKGNKKNSSADKHKSDRGIKVEGILATKIQQSIDRARFVQNARKSGWEQINKSVNLQPRKENAEELAKTQAQIEKEEEDEYVKQFYIDAGKEEDAGKKEVKKEEAKANALKGNVFALLDETEA